VNKIAESVSSSQPVGNSFRPRKGLRALGRWVRIPRSKTTSYWQSCLCAGCKSLGVWGAEGWPRIHYHADCSNSFGRRAAWFGIWSKFGLTPQFEQPGRAWPTLLNQSLFVTNRALVWMRWRPFAWILSSKIGSFYTYKSLPMFKAGQNCGMWNRRGSQLPAPCC